MTSELFLNLLEKGRSRSRRLNCWLRSSTNCRIQHQRPLTKPWVEWQVSYSLPTSRQ